MSSSMTIDFVSGATKIIERHGTPVITLTLHSKVDCPSSVCGSPLRLFRFKVAMNGKATGADKLHLFCDGGGNFIAVIDPDTDHQVKYLDHLASFPLLEEERIDANEERWKAIRTSEDRTFDLTTINWPLAADFAVPEHDLPEHDIQSPLQKLTFRGWMSHLDRVAMKNGYSQDRPPSVAGHIPSWRKCYNQGMRPTEAWNSSW